MKKARSNIAGKGDTRVAVWPPSLQIGRRRGSLLLEAIIAIGIFSIFVAGMGLSLLLGQRSTLAGGDRSRAAFIAEQQLEAVRHIRSSGFDSVTTGLHGVALTPSGWAFSGTSLMADGYWTAVNVTSQGTDWLRADATVTWDFGKTRSGALLLTTYLTNWRKVATVGNWAAMTNIAQVDQSGSPDFQKIVISGIYAYATGTISSGGKGLYVYDISNPASPVRVSTTFDLGASAYDLAAIGNRLYLATDDTVKEVQVYDISSPATLTTGNLINSFDLAGSGKARSIAVYGANIFVGSLSDGTNPELSSIEMSETGPMTLLSTLGMSGSLLGLALQDGYAYGATSNNAGELEVADIFDPENLTFAPGTGIDMTNMQDCNAITLTGTSALVGRLNGSAIDELTLYDIGSSPVPNPPPGPWTLEIGGDVNSLSTVFGSKYAFVGSSTDGAQIKVLDLVKFAQSAAPVVRNYDTSATIRGLVYDWQTDRLFAVSASSLFVFAPG